MASTHLVLTLTGPTTVRASGPVGFTLSVRNNGPDKANGAKLTIAVSAGLRKVKTVCGNAAGGARCPSAIPRGGSVSVKIPKLPSGGSFTATVTGTAGNPSDGPITISAKILPPPPAIDPTPGAAAASLSTAIKTTLDFVVSRFLADSSAVTPGQEESERVPATWFGNQVDPLIDGSEYFLALRRETDALLTASADTKPFFYFANWLLAVVGSQKVSVTPNAPIGSAYPADADKPGAFHLPADGAKPAVAFADRIAALIDAGVDVRSFAWVSPYVFKREKISSAVETERAVNLMSIESTVALRDARPAVADRFLLDTLCHTMGSMHLKMVLAGDQSGMRAYVSGLDLAENRQGTPLHDLTKGHKWHDGGVRIVGPATGEIYDFYRQLWNEQRHRKVETLKLRLGAEPEPLREIVSHFDTTPPVPERPTEKIAPGGTQIVQVLRTLPQMNFALAWSDVLPTIPTDVPVLGPLLGVPVLGPLLEGLSGCLIRLFGGLRSDPFSFAPKGLFEVPVALRKAIANADTYIYMEDQEFKGLEIMYYINQRLKDPAAANLKIVMLWNRDPSDPVTSFMYYAVNKVLIDGIADPGSRVFFYQRAGIVVHAKLMIIDDLWAMIGSANHARRSLYTDVECSVGVVDDAAPGVKTFPQRLRLRLWGEHCGLTEAQAATLLADPVSALAVWTRTGLPPAGQPYLRGGGLYVRKTVPFELVAQDPTPSDKFPIVPGVLAPDGSFNMRDYPQNDLDSRKEV